MTDVAEDAAEQDGYAAVWARLSAGRRVTAILDLDGTTTTRINAWMWHCVQAAIRAALATERVTAGVGSDEDAPPAPQDEPGAANTPQEVAREGRNALRASEAVPEDVQKTAWTDLDGAMHSVWLHANWTWLLTKMTTEQADAAQAAKQRHQRILNAADDLGINPAHVEEHDAAEPMHITGYQPDKPIRWCEACGRDLAIGHYDDCSSQNAPHQHLIERLDAALHKIYLQAGTWKFLATQLTVEETDAVVDAIQRQQQRLEPDTELPLPNLYDLRFTGDYPTPVEVTETPGQREAQLEADGAGGRLRAHLDRALALLHDLLSESRWYEKGHPGYAARRTGWVEETRLTEWRERMAAIEEATGRG